MKKTDGRSKAARAEKEQKLFELARACKTSDGKIVEIEVADAGKARDRQVGGDHYKKLAIQPWDAMKVWLTPEQYIGYHKAAVIGYVARCDDKGGLEDIKKALHHLVELIEFSEEQ